jgi:hypothetical protein
MPSARDISMRFLKEWLERYPYPSNWFIGAALVLSASTILGPVAMEEMVADILGVLLFFTVAITAMGMSILFTSWHWFVFGWIARRYSSRGLMTIFGSILFCSDAFLRISAIFFSGSSRGPVFSLLLYFIPILLGIGLLPFYFVSGWMWSRRKAA